MIRINNNEKVIDLLYIALALNFFIIMCCFSVYATWPTSVNPNLIHYWTLDDGNGTVAVDSMSKANGVLINGYPYEISGKINKAFRMIDGRTINYSNSITKNLNRNFSVNFWLYFVSGAAYSEFFTNGQNGDGSFAILKGASNGGIKLSKHGVVEEGCETGAIPTNTWIMVTLNVYPNGVEEFYINSILNCSSTLAQTYTSSGTSARIGTFSDYVNTISIDEVSVFNRTLNTSEISQIYNSGSGATYSTGSDNVYPQFYPPSSIFSDVCIPDVSYYSNFQSIGLNFTNTNGSQGIELDHQNISYNISSTYITFQKKAGSYIYYLWGYGNGSSHNFNRTYLCYYNITKASPTLEIYNQSVNKTYPNPFDYSGNCQSPLTCSFNYNPALYKVGTYLINYSTNGNENYTSDSITFYVSELINDTLAINLFINNTSQNLTILNGTTLNITAYLINLNQNLSLKINNTFINSSFSPLIQFYKFINSGIHTILVEFLGNENYTSVSKTLYVNVSLSPSYVDNSTNQSQNQTYSFNYTYSKFRILYNLLSIAFTDKCGNDLTSYESVGSYESGCSSYTGSVCDNRIFLDRDYTYTLLTNNYGYNPPNWTSNNYSCLFYGYNGVKSRLFQAWRVSGNGGQFCTTQNKWNYYYYDISSGNYSINTSKYYISNLSYSLDFGCNYTAPNQTYINNTYINNTQETFDNETIPQNSSTTPTNGAILNVSFPSWVYVVIMILAFILFLCLVYFGFYILAGCLAVFFGLIMLLSGILWIISISIVLGGIAVLFIPSGFSFRRK